MKIQLNKEIDLEQKVKQALGTRPYSFHYADEAPGTDAIIAYVCPHCGAESYGSWKTWYLWAKQGKDVEYSDEDKAAIYAYENELKTYFLEEASDILKLKECPLCATALSRENGFYLEVTNRTSDKKYGLNFYRLANNKIVKKNSGIRTYESHLYSTMDYYFGKGSDSLFAFIKKQRDEVEQALAEEKISGKVSLFDAPAFAMIAADRRDAIKNTPEKLKEYILNLIKLEVNIYSLTQRLTALYSQEHAYKRQANALASAPLYEKRELLSEKEDLLNDWFGKLAKYKAGEIGVARPLSPLPPTYKTPGLLNKKKILAENEELQAQYQNALRAYEEKLQAFETKKEKLIAEAQTEVESIKADLNAIKEEMRLSRTQDHAGSPAATIKTIIDEEIADAEAMLKKLYECRNNLYAYDIVFGKYRNAVALSTFYEYLMSGRCSALEGATGAYNLYEEQVRADMIIGQLAQVIERLDKIQNTQYMIYSELQTVNKNLDYLNKTMDAAMVSLQNMEKDIANISANTDVIAHNSAVSAYYSKLNAELTNSLGYMMAFN